MKIVSVEDLESFNFKTLYCFISIRNKLSKLYEDCAIDVTESRQDDLILCDRQRLMMC